MIHSSVFRVGQLEGWIVPIASQYVQKANQHPNKSLFCKFLPISYACPVKFTLVTAKFTPLNPQRLFNWGAFHCGAIYYELLSPLPFLILTTPQRPRTSSHHAPRNSHHATRNSIYYVYPACRNEVEIPFSGPEQSGDPDPQDPVECRASSSGALIHSTGAITVQLRLSIFHWDLTH